MTAARKLCAPMEVVPDHDGTDAAPEGGGHWRSQIVLDQYSPEHQFVGLLMWLSAQAARPLLDLVPDTAIWRPQTRWAYELVRRLVQAGTDPTPVSVLAAGRHQPARDALHPDTAPTSSQHKHLALYLFDAHAQAVAPTAAVGTYAREVLDDAYRRAFDTCGTRMKELAAAGADRDVICRNDSAPPRLAVKWRIGKPYATADTRKVSRKS
jgi:hypothetical protein